MPRLLRSRPSLSLFLALSCGLALAGCAARNAPVTPSSAVSTKNANVLPYGEERALLLLMEDRRTADPAVVERFASGAAPLRERVAVALGRIGDPAFRATLEVLLIDGEAPVRRAAAFALGELGQAASRAALLRAAADPDRETGSLAVEALAKGGAESTSVEAALAGLSEEERWPRLLPFLFRFKDSDAVRLAAEGLRNLDPALHARAAYALAREPQPAGVSYLRLLLADADPWVRDWAARGLGVVGDASDLARLRPLLDDPQAGPVIQTLRSGRRLVAAGKLAAPAGWRPRLQALIDDPRPGVAVTALEAAGSWLRHDEMNELGAALAARAVDDQAPPRQRELALLALAEGRDDRAGALVSRWSHAATPTERTRAAEAAAKLGDRPTLERLLDDASPTVRAAAFDALLQAPAAPVGGAAAQAPADRAGTPAFDAAVEAIARRALVDPDPIVRAAALDAVGAAFPATEIAQALERATSDTLNDAELAAVRALGARGQKAGVAERAACVGALQTLAAGHRDILVRRQAAQALFDLGETRPAVGAASDRDLDAYRATLRRAAGEHAVDLVTERGTIRIRLFCTDAPLTCVNFLQLAGQGYFDGLRFHRVVPDFVVQGGDPRGDGAGGPGYQIRDEINRHRYVRGAVGMALSGPDTGGSQFFLTLTPQPHLDGGYTVFGEVISGMDVADALQQGDRIERAVPVEAVSGPVR